MQDNLGLLFTVGVMALLFLMDVLARRKHQGRRDEVEEPESRRVREPAAGGAGPSEPVAWEAKSDWAYLRRGPGTVRVGGSGGRTRRSRTSRKVRARAGFRSPTILSWSLPPPPGTSRPRCPCMRRRRSANEVAATSLPFPQPPHARWMRRWPLRPRVANAQGRSERAGSSGCGRSSAPTPRPSVDAVLFREILGRPLGSRPGPGGWQEPG